MDITSILKDCDFTLRFQAKRIGLNRYVKVSFAEISNIIVNLISLPSTKTAVSYTIDQDGRLVVPISGEGLVCNSYGIEILGFYNNGNWRHQIAPIVDIVNSSTEDNYALGETDNLTLDFDIILGETYVSSRSFSGTIDGIIQQINEIIQSVSDAVSGANSAVATHNSSNTAHEDIRTAIGNMLTALTAASTAITGLQSEKIDDVKVDGTSVVETDTQTGKKIVNLHKDQLGKVDDVIVNGDSVLNQNNEAEFTVPTTVEELGDSFNYATKADLISGLADKQDTISVVVTPSVTEDGGSPAVVSSFNNNQLSLAFKNLEGPQGPQGESVLVGQGDLPLVHVPGYDATKAMSQKGVTMAMDDALSAVKRVVGLTPASIETGNNLKKNGTTATGGDNSVIKEYALEEGKSYYVTCRVPSSSTYAGIVFFDSNDDPTARFVGDGTDTHDAVKVPLAPPDGAVRVKVYGSKLYHEPMLYEEVGTIDVQDLSDNVDKVLSVLPDDIDTLAKFELLPENGIDVGYYLKTNGTYAESTANARIKIFTNIDNTLEYFATFRVSKPTTAAAVGYYREDDSFISAQYAGDGATAAHDVTKAPLTLPPSTSIIRIFYSIGEVGQLYVKRGTIDLGDLYADVEAMKSYPLRGKKIAVVGDSISTIMNGNTPYIKITESDVAHEIQSYVSWNDIYTDNERETPTNKTIGGQVLTENMVDGQLHTFVPSAEDVGKELFVARHYSGNKATLKTWAQVLCEKSGATLTANASFSGSSINSSESVGRGQQFEGSHAWHPCTIGRCRTRDDNGNVILPDVIIIARGTNDLSYTNNANYPVMSLEFPDMSNGINWVDDCERETVNGEEVVTGYNFVKAYILTIQRLRQEYPNATIFCATPNIFKRIIYNNYPTRNNAWSLPDLCNCIRKIADYMGCGLIEFDKDGITWDNMYPRYIEDSPYTPTHPNGNGHRVMGEKAAADLKYVLNP